MDRWFSKTFVLHLAFCLFFHVFSKVNRGFNLTTKEENAVFHQLSQHAALSAFVAVCSGYYQNISSVSLSIIADLSYIARLIFLDENKHGFAEDFLGTFLEVQRAVLALHLLICSATLMRHLRAPNNDD